MIEYEIIEIIIGGMLFLCMLKDIRKRKVSLIALGAGFGLLLLLLPFCQDFRLWDSVNGVWIGLSLMGLSWITRGKIGMGDGIVYCVTGIGLGFYRNLHLLCISLFLAAILSFVLWGLKKLKRDTAFPFTPFIFAAYLGLVVIW